MQKKTIAIFASGNGTNAVNIINYFAEQKFISFLVYSNNKNAPVLEKAKRLGITTQIFDKHTFYRTEIIKNHLLEKKIDLIVLAGFLWLIPESIIDAFPQKIINIHPSLLPKYGGKGMYGRYVHEAVIDAQEKTSGITIHYVNSKYDEGTIICQKKCAITPSDTPTSLAAKIHKLEHIHFPKVIANMIL